MTTTTCSQKWLTSVANCSVFRKLSGMGEEKQFPINTLHVRAVSIQSSWLFSFARVAFLLGIDSFCFHHIFMGYLSRWLNEQHDWSSKCFADCIL